MDTQRVDNANIYSKGDGSIVVESNSVWPNGWDISLIFGHLQQRKFAQWNYAYEICQTSLKTLTNSQSCQSLLKVAKVSGILPNLVTLYILWQFSYELYLLQVEGEWRQKKGFLDFFCYSDTPEDCLIVCSCVCGRGVTRC